MSSPAQDTLMGSSSVNSEVIAAVANINMSVDNMDIAEDGEISDYHQVLREEARQRKARSETVRKRIADNGFALRKTLMGETIKGYYPSPLSMEEMSIADLLSEIPDEDLLFVGSIKDRIYMPAEFFQKWVRPTIRVQKALKQSQDQELPGGMEAAMLASIFDQSVMDFTKPNNGNLANNRALRAMVWHTKDDNAHQFLPMEEGGRNLAKGLTSTLQKLKQVAQLPNEQVLLSWEDGDIGLYHEEIAEAIAQYESHVRRDHDNMILLREQNAILARLVWEQQIQICDLNERYLHVAEEKSKLVQTEDKTIVDNMFDITTLMMSLKDSLQQRQQKVDEISSPIDLSKIATTINKLKSALLDIDVTNTSLVKKNNSLVVELSFMPEGMREKIRGAPIKRDNQRTDPHYLVPDGNKFVFQRANLSDPIVAELQTGSHYRSVGHLLQEADDVMNIINGTQSDANQGMNTQGASSTAPPLAPAAQNATTVGEPRGANKRTRDTMVAPGLNVQSDNNNQSSYAATNMANSALLTVVPTARIRGPIREVAVPARQSSSSIPVAQAVTSIAPETALHSAAQAASVVSTYQQITASAPRASLATPEYHYSTPSRQGPSYDPASYGNRNPRFATGKGTGKGKGKGKGKAYNTKDTWGAMPRDYDPDQVVIPELGSATDVVFHTFDSLTTENQTPYTVRIPTLYEVSPNTGLIILHMDIQEIRKRINPSDLNGDGTPISNIVFHYNTAIKAIHEVRQSVTHFQIMEATGRVVNLRGEPYANGHKVDPHYLLADSMKALCGDFWRILRHRPVSYGVRAANPDIEYVPSNPYSYYQVKKTLMQSAQVQVKPSRYWDERPAKNIPDDIFYSLSEYWPSMPRDVDIVNENTCLGLPLYRMNEQRRTNQKGPGTKPHMVNDNSYTIEYLLATGAVANEQNAFEAYANEIQMLESKYANHISKWPFLAAQRLLKMQLYRLRAIRIALFEGLEHFGADGAGYINPNPNTGYNPSDLVRNEGQTAEVVDTGIDLMLFQRGETDGEPSQSEIRPGQQGPGGWQF